MKPATPIVAGLFVALAAPAAAVAHVDIVSGPVTANTTQRVTFGVGHGCSGTDTFAIRVTIPPSITSVRPEASAFGRMTIEKDAAGTVTAVSWQKAEADLLPADLGYYEMRIRLRVPDQPFTTLFFPVRQTCRAMDGTMTTVDWSMLPADAPLDGGADEPAPGLRILPARFPGWNKFVVPAAISDLAAVFGDARIVWKGTAAWSANPATVELIDGTPGVTRLGSVAANDEIWVKY